MSVLKTCFPLVMIEKPQQSVFVFGNINYQGSAKLKIAMMVLIKTGLLF